MSWWRSKREDDLDRELRSHLEAEADEQGDFYGARRALGNMSRVKEDVRDAWGWTWLERLGQDLLYALRTMKQSPGFTATAVLSLALGIGANTAIFSLINAILLKPLPVSDPGTLVVIAPYSQDGDAGDFGYPDYLAIRDGNRAFSGVLAASSLEHVDVGLDAETEAAQRKIVSGNYFSVLGVLPALGRLFSDEDETQQVAVISDRFWKGSFGGSPSVVGKQIELDGSPFIIVGVAPPDFAGETVGEAPDLWATVSLMPAGRRNLPGFSWLNLMGRLKRGVPPQQADADLSLLLPQLPLSVPRGGFIQRLATEPGRLGGPGLRNSFSFPLTILMAVVTVVLLIACTNLASLLLARAATRQREIATRLALGAGRGRIVRQLMTESVLMALMGGVLGLSFAVWSQRLLLTLIAGAGRTITLNLHPDLRILLFTGAISIATGLLFGLAPALQAVRHGIGAPLKFDRRTLVSGRRRRGMKSVLVTLQVALSLLLLVVGGLFIRTLRNLRTQDVGFRADHVLSLEIGSQGGYRPEWGSVTARLLPRIEGIPGVRAASVSFNGTLSDSASGVAGLQVDGYVPVTKQDQRAQANWVGPRYFETSGVPLLEGREFSAADGPGARKVAIVNQTMARHFFPDKSAVGQRLEFNKETYEIIGLAKDAKYSDLRQLTPRLVYFAALQNNSDIHSLEVRTAGSPLALAGVIRDAVRETDPLLRIGGITTLEQRIDQKLSVEVLIADITGFFGGLTLLLVSIGIYGTLAYSVAQRTQEMGIRMALGAKGGHLIGTVVKGAGRLVLAGIALGLPAAWAASRLLKSMLFGLTPMDPATIASAAMILAAAALLAAYLPARRASRVDPMAALRHE